MTSHSINQEELLKTLNTNEQTGLTNEEAKQRLQQDGENVLRAKKKKTMFQRFMAQFKDVMILILIAAAVVSFAIAIYEKNPKEFFEPSLIMLIVILNALMGIIQESKAEKALEALQSLSALQIGRAHV